MVPNILLVHASSHGTESRGYILAKRAVENIRRVVPDLNLVERDVGTVALPPLDRAYALGITSGAASTAPEFDQSEHLIRELETADYLVIAAPMHNYAVPASLKIWIDYILRYGRTFKSDQGYKIGLLRDRPTLIIVSSGGIAHGDLARQPDHFTPYMRDVLSTIGIIDLEFVHVAPLAQVDFANKAVESASRQIDSDPVFGSLKAA